MKILITARELMDRHQWDRACELAGLSPWAVNEGQMDMDDEVTLTAEAAGKLGLLAAGVYMPEGQSYGLIAAGRPTPAWAGPPDMWERPPGPSPSASAPPPSERPLPSGRC